MIPRAFYNTGQKGGVRSVEEIKYNLTDDKAIELL